MYESTFNDSMLYFIVGCLFILLNVKLNEKTTSQASTQVGSILSVVLLVQGIVILLFTSLCTLNRIYDLGETFTYKLVHGYVGAIMGYVSFVVPYCLFVLLKKYIGGNSFLKGAKNKLLFLIFILVSVFYFIDISTLIFQNCNNDLISFSILENLLLLMPVTQILFYIMCAKYLHRFFINTFEGSSASKKATLIAEILFIVSPIVATPFSGIYAYPICFAIMVCFVFVVQIVSQDRSVSIDFLTGLNNRKKLSRYLKRLFEKPAELDHNLNLIFIDINDFKSVNDTYGHNIGDKALMNLSNCLKKASSKYSCFLCRYAGDEFTVVLKHTILNSVDEYIKTVEFQIDELNKSGKLPFDLSISIGAVQYNESISNEEEFIAQADAKMYEEKQNYKARKEKQESPQFDL